MPQTRDWFRITSLVVVSSTLLACQPKPRPPGPPGKSEREAPSLRVDPSLAPEWSLPARADGAPQPMAAVADATGAVSTFVEDEVIVSSPLPGQLERILELSGGTVVADDTVPAPPAGSGIRFDPAAFPPTTFVVRLDLAKLDGSLAPADAAALGFEGEARVSSEAGARTLAFIARSAVSKLPVTMNLVMEGDQALLLSTRESTAVPPQDAFAWTRFQAGAPEKSSTVEAWQFVAAHGIKRRVRVAIIDGGFWMQPDGKAQVAAGGTDFPAHPLQYDFVDDDYVADSQNPNSCTGGSACPWHGNGAASVATAILNNAYGAAGTGGTVSDPMLFHVQITNGMVKRAIRTAVAWQADIVSMSFGGHCNDWCRIGRTIDHYYQVIHDAKAGGLLVFASAGNDGNAVGVDRDPCAWAHLCVGMLGPGTNVADTISNFGGPVALFAPTGIPQMPNTAPAPVPLSTFGGTSAATPFVAGVAAMMKALDPALSADQIVSMLKETAWQDSTDPKVLRYLNSFAAVRKAAKDQLPPDRDEPNDAIATATPIPSAGGTVLLHTIHRSTDRDFYRIDTSDYLALDLQIDHPTGLASLGYGLNSASWAGFPTGVQTQRNPNQYRYHADRLPPGQWILNLRADAPTIYNLTVQTTPAPLAPDAFEVNDTAGQAASPAPGDHRATLHLSSDVDWYEVDVPANGDAGFRGFHFTVHSSDQPITVDVFDAANNRVASRVVVGSTAESIVIPAGRHRVRVTGARATQYAFSMAATLDRSIISSLPAEIREFPAAWPGVRPGILWGPEVFLGIVLEDPAVNRLELRGAVRGQLLDGRGAEAGRAVPLGPKLPGMGMDLSAVPRGIYALRIQRAEPNDGLEPTGEVPYRLSFGAAERPR